MNAEADALLNGKPESIGDLFDWRVATTPDNEAFRYPDSSDGWVSLTWAQTRERVRELGAGLLTLSVGQAERVSIASTTRLEWILADLAVNVIGAATTTIYPNTAPTTFSTS